MRTALLNIFDKSEDLLPYYPKALLSLGNLRHSDRLPDAQTGSLAGLVRQPSNSPEQPGSVGGSGNPWEDSKDWVHPL